MARGTSVLAAQRGWASAHGIRAEPGDFVHAIIAAPGAESVVIYSHFGGSIKGGTPIAGWFPGKIPSFEMMI